MNTPDKLPSCTTPADQGAPRHWFGRGSGKQQARPGPMPASMIEMQRRRVLLDRIADLLLDNHLEVSASNLAAAHMAFSGANPDLAHKIAQRRTDAKPISQTWLDRAAAADCPDEASALEALRSQLQSGLDQFAAATRSASSAQGEYHQALTHQVDALGTSELAPEVALANLATIASAMLERTAEVAAAMKRSEEEAGQLRHSLAKARHDAEVDHLTGLMNRRAFESVMAREYAEAKAAGEPLCVAFADIDFFKRVNDTHGHETGDRVLKAVAQLLAKIADDRCHVARHGGEEFVMLLRGATPDIAAARLNMARIEVGARNLVNRHTQEAIGAVTFSAGVADVFACTGLSAALAAADRALYRAKSEGRNQVVVAQD